MKIEQFLKKSPIIPIIFTATKIENDLRQKLSQHDLSILESLVLVAIVFEGKDCRPSEIAAGLQISRVRVSQIIKNLIQKNFVSRSIVGEDARFISIKITPRGKSVSSKLVSIFERSNTLIENQLGAKNSEQAASHLYKLNLALSEKSKI